MQQKQSGRKTACMLKHTRHSTTTLLSQLPLKTTLSPLTRLLYPPITERRSALSHTRASAAEW